MTTYRILTGTERSEFHADKITECQPHSRMAVTMVFAPETPHKHIRAVALLASSEGLKVKRHPSPHAITLRGTTAIMQHVFNVELKMHETADGIFRCRKGPVGVPTSFGSRVTAVLGLDTRPQAKPRYRAHANPQAGANGYTARQLAGIYGFPGGGGHGHSVGIIELGGSYQPNAMQAYFRRAGIELSPNVTVKGTQHPRQTDASVEVMLDCEIIASLLPRAETVIYFGPNTTAGFYNAIALAVRARHDAIAICWGSAEDTWTGASMDAFNTLAQTAGAAGVTITAASGDNGSSDGESGLNVDFPASAPNILGCGGTKLIATDGVYGNETVWNSGGGATGGGYSAHFSLPDYQSAVNIGGNTHRMVPDVAANADPDSGYFVRVNGQNMEVGGTSASAPLWAALICRLNAALGRTGNGRLGFIQPALYALPAGSLRDVTIGSNGAYSAGIGFDCATGLGSPPANLQELLS